MPVFAVVTAKGAKWDHARGIREQPYWEDHAAFMDGLVERGIVIMGGPIGQAGPDVIALLAVNADNAGTLRTIFDADPWIKHQVFQLEKIWPWTIWLDGRSR